MLSKLPWLLVPGVVLLAILLVGSSNREPSVTLGDLQRVNRQIADDQKEMIKELKTVQEKTQKKADDLEADRPELVKAYLEGKAQLEDLKARWNAEMKKFFEVI